MEKKQDRRDAAIASGANDLTSGLQYIPQNDPNHLSAGTFTREPFKPDVTAESLPPHPPINPATSPLDLFCAVC